MRKPSRASHRLAASLFAVAVAAAGLGATTVGAIESKVTLAGCLVRAESGDPGYLITNTPSEPASVNAEETRVNPNAFGAVGGFTTVVYWLENDDDLKPHVGHRVEVEGDLKGEPKDGEMATDRKDHWTEVTVKSDGRTLHVNVPHTSVEPAPAAKRTDKREVLVRRVEVEHVRMLGAGCAP